MSVQQSSHRLRAFDIAPLCALGSARQQDNDLTTALGEIHSPPRADMNTKLRDAVPDWLHVAEKASFQTFDASHHDASNRGICKTV
ncbi:hypothetical protein ASC95_12565 [Pelomonas sp. Root1217]|nr:hypothetical protein ASC95_12565 [Pelomonas sp. Root1217]